MRALICSAILIGMLTGVGASRTDAASKMACSILQQKVKAAKTASDRAARQREYNAACGKPIPRVVAPAAPQQPPKPKPVVAVSKPKVAVRRKSPAAAKKPLPIKKRRAPAYEPPPFVVTVEGPGRRYPTIQSAVNAVASGGTIWVTPSYLAETAVYISKSVSISGVLTGKANPSLAVSSFIVNNGNVTIRNISINSTNDYTISVLGGSLSIYDSDIYRTDGTSIYLSNANLTIQNSIINSSKGHRIWAVGNYNLKVNKSNFYGGNSIDILAKKSGTLDIKDNIFQSDNSGSWLCVEVGTSHYPFLNNVGKNSTKLEKYYFYDPAKNTCN